MKRFLCNLCLLVTLVPDVQGFSSHSGRPAALDLVPPAPQRTGILAEVATASAVPPGVTAAPAAEFRSGAGTQGKRTQVFLGFVLLAWLGATGVICAGRYFFPKQFTRRVLIGLFFLLWFAVGMTVYTTQPWLQAYSNIESQAEFMTLKEHLGPDGRTLNRDFYHHRETVPAGYRVHECDSGLWKRGDLPNVNNASDVDSMCAPPSTIKFAREYNAVMATYLMAEIASTVGYGDLCPVNWSGQLFTAFFALYSTLLAAGVLAEVGSRILTKHHELVNSKVINQVEGLRGAIISEPLPQSHVDLINAFAVFIIFVIIGMLFYAYYCDPMTAWCEANHPVTALYFTVITTTTVGFGDVTPNTIGGRIFAVLLMILGVAAFVNFASAFANIAFSEPEPIVDVQNELSDAMAEDLDHKLYRHELYRHVLLDSNMVDKAILDRIDSAFRKLDVEKKGYLTLEDLEGADSPMSTARVLSSRPSGRLRPAEAIDEGEEGAEAAAGSEGAERSARTDQP
mmetsp:Transcript_124180/g.284653  ORF Transcript_124180/g.284653 Transcript_124180/m.284653 type:complete len:511 (-) Transcript_124180:13-1545(-)